MLFDHSSHLLKTAKTNWLLCCMQVCLFNRLLTIHNGRGGGKGERATSSSQQRCSEWNGLTGTKKACIWMEDFSQSLIYWRHRTLLVLYRWRESDACWIKRSRKHDRTASEQEEDLIDDDRHCEGKKVQLGTPKSPGTSSNDLRCSSKKENDMKDELQLTRFWIP